MSFEIIKATKNITEKYTRYLRTMFDIDDPDYKELFEKEMTKIESFSKGPYLDVVDSFESGMSVKELISEGLLNPSFTKIDSIICKTLYKHQEQSIRKIADGRNLVVSTGTGSGKTESFLIPVLNTLMNEYSEKGTLSPGVRALLVYPMNALANDQISRLRELLKDLPFITFGSYTGQTEETEFKALAKYKSLNNGRVPQKNELISRESMKDTPPHILITNYSMLEYLMLRPRDNTLFQGYYADRWTYVVLDEAHTYSGSTGIEVSMLLRRLKAYSSNPDLRFILTSATLGGENSNEDVATFASRLCDAKFYADDVIRASRIKLTQEENAKRELSTDDYKELNDIIDSGNSDESIYKMIKTYLSSDITAEDYYELLFDELIKDDTFWRVKQLLDSPKTVKELCEALCWEDSALSSFVNVTSHAVKNRKKLFDARYHMFLRATDGVYITLGAYKDLSLTRCTTKKVGTDEYRYFEIVTCGQCHAIYLLGVIEEDGGSKYLRQKSNLAGNNIKEAFLVGSTVSNEDEDSSLADEHLQITDYELCPHCGFVRETNQVHKAKCEHSESDYIPLTKVKQSERTGRVTKCLKCECVNNLGVLRSFFSGQEASTSVVGTALFEELPSVEVKYCQVKDDDSGFDFGDGFDDITKEEYITKAKQFIAFSDNRQAAAFFATYFYGTYQSLLYSRIVRENIKNTNEEGKPIPFFVKDMAQDFKKHGVCEMFDDHPDYLKESWKAVMKELVESYSRNSLTGLGMMKIDFCRDIQMPANKKYGLDSEEIATVCLVLLRNLFEDNAIFLPYNFLESDIAFYSNNGSEKVYQLVSQDKFVRSFVPKSDSTTNKRFEYLQRVFKAKGVAVDRESMVSFMNAIWNLIFERNEIVKDRYDHAGKQVNLSKFRIANTRSWYRCSKCQRITAYNVSDVCPAFKCDGVLEKVDIDNLEKDNHYFKMYNELDMRPLRVVEHTAQLNSEEAYRLQEQFKNQEIDVLSCSTTFEMGVDIGDLETVFMRNMPPTPSNYVQRAGRAGRSTKSAALALTFCNKSNHDFSYFSNPLSMINGEIQPPLFKVENEKIGIRHVYSAALAFFWKENPWCFGSIKDMFGSEDPTCFRKNCGDSDGKVNYDGYADFKAFLEKKPDSLKEYLLKALPSELVSKYQIETFGWVKWLFDEPQSIYPNMKNVYEQYRSEVDTLFEEKKRLESANQYNGAILSRINTYTKDNCISFLSRNNILPKYGFPVDTVNLYVTADRNARVLPVDLSRDLAVAISEYAPGCEVVAAGNLIKSRYIKKMPNRLWRQFDYVQCNNCKTLNITMHLDDREGQSLLTCEHCNQVFRKHEIKTFLIPEFGFSSETKLAKPSLIKPERTFRTEASMVAQGKTTYRGEYSFGNMDVVVTTVEDGEIAILNKSDFYVCTSCGYALAEHEAKSFSFIVEKDHTKPSGFKCQNKMLRRFSLGYRFKTDALHISISDTYEYDEAYSILQAIILSACHVLNIDNNEISGCLQYRQTEDGSTYDFIIYDTTPGGAGHVRRIDNKQTLLTVFREAYRKSKSCDCGGEEGDTSCYKCLRTYQNQQHHDILKRKYVVDRLRDSFDIK